MLPDPSHVEPIGMNPDHSTPRPTPVRQLPEVASSASAETRPPDECVFREGDGCWTARVAGYQKGVGSGSAGLILVVFGPREDPFEPVREMWVPGEGLASLSEDVLVEAFRAAVPYRGDGTAKPADADGRTRSGRGA